MSQSPKQDFDPRTHLIEALCESPMDEDEVYPRARTYDRLLDEVLEERRRASRSGNLCTALVGVVTAIGALFCVPPTDVDYRSCFAFCRCRFDGRINGVASRASGPDHNADGFDCRS